MAGLRKFFLGGVVGAVLGVLFAPRPGNETREQLRSRADNLMEEGRGRFENQRERLTDVYEASRDTATRTADELRARLDDARSRLRQVAGEAEETVTEVAAEVEEKAEAGAEPDVPKTAEG